MKKHFLLFVLMALLPLAAWADGELTLELRKTQFVYKGAAISAQIKSVKYGNYTLTAGTHYSADLTYNATPWDVGEYTVTVHGIANNDYGGMGSMTGTATIHITAADLQLTAAQVSKVYGQADPAPNFTVSGFQGDDDTYDIDVTGLTMTREEGETVGSYSYSINASAANSGNPNYNLKVTGSNSTLNITKKEVTLDWSTAPLTYNKTPQAPAASVTNPSYGDIIGVTVIGQEINAGTGYTATASALTGEKAANYKLPAANTHEFAIGQKTLTITADAKSKTYGENDPALTYTATGLEAGDAITGALDRAATEGDPVGNYAITLSTLSAGNNYSISYTGANLTINQREVELAWSTDPLTYNRTPQAPTATAGNLVNNDVIGVTVTGKETAAGEGYTATASALTGDKAANYKLPTADADKQTTFAIGQKEVGLTWSDGPLTYNKTAQAPTATATGVVEGDVVYVTVTGAQTNYSANAYTAEATELTGTDAANYKLPTTGTTKTFTIGQKALTITAVDKEKTYGESDPELTYTANGLVDGDAITGALSRDEGEVVIAGGYAINQGDLTAGDNYIITYNGANLTINQREVTLAWTNTALTYTGSAQKPTATAGNLVNNDEIGVTVSVEGEHTAAGENYTATASALTGEKAGNYKLPNVVEQSFSIGGAAVTITADNQTITYGDPINLDAYTSSGLQAGHSVKSVTLTASTTNATQNGTITPSGVVIVDGGNNDVTTNYAISGVNGTLIINQKPVTITANPQTVDYGTAITVAANKVDAGGNLLAGHSVKSVTLTPSTDQATTTGFITPSDIVIQDDGSNDVTGNYAITTATGALTINKVALALTAKDQDVNYPNAANLTVGDETITYDANQLKNGDAITGIGLALVCNGTSIGTHSITINTDNASQNYTYSITNGTLTISNTANTLELAGADTDFQKIKDYHGQQIKVTINLAARNGRSLGGERNWVKENWVTLTLPFDITVAQLSQKLGYALVNVIDPTQTVIDGTGSKFYGKLTMKGGYGEDYLPANKPLLVKIADDIVNTGNHGVVDFGLQTIIAPATEADLTVDAGNGAKFIGTYASKEVSSADNENIWFMIGGGYTQWAYIKSTSAATWTIQPFEAYIDMSGAPSYSAPNMTFYFEEFDGSTTAIRSVDADNMNKKLNAEGWYTLNGVKLQNAPTEKGIYIKDGKKIVIK